MSSRSPKLMAPVGHTVGARRLQPDLEAVGAERALVDQRRAGSRSRTWESGTGTPACRPGSRCSATALNTTGPSARLRQRRGRTRRRAGRMVAVHAELAPEHPVGLGAGGDLVEGDERVVVGVEIARVLIAGAGEEVRVCRRAGRSTTCTPPCRPGSRCTGCCPGSSPSAVWRGRRHARPFFLMLQRNTLVSGICELASPTLAVRSLAMSPGTMPA